MNHLRTVEAAYEHVLWRKQELEKELEKAQRAYEYHRLADEPEDADYETKAFTPSVDADEEQEDYRATRNGRVQPRGSTKVGLELPPDMAERVAEFARRRHIGMRGACKSLIYLGLREDDRSESTSGR